MSVGLLQCPPRRGSARRANQDSVLFSMKLHQLHWLHWLHRAEPLPPSRTREHLSPFAHLDLARCSPAARRTCHAPAGPSTCTIRFPGWAVLCCRCAEPPSLLMPCERSWGIRGGGGWYAYVTRVSVLPGYEYFPRSLGPPMLARCPAPNESGFVSTNLWYRGDSRIRTL